MPHLKLRTRFTLILSLIFIAAFFGSWLVFSQVLQRNAEDEISSRGLTLMALLSSVRNYTSQHINPMLAEDMDTSPTFISESVPAFSVRMVFDGFKSADQYSQFVYKEAALDPTNQSDIADSFEEALIQSFRTNTALTELSGFTTLNGEQVFYTARPLSVTAESCLKCHGSPDDAPASMIAAYGSEHGFGWQMGDIVAARTLYIPAQQVFDQAQEEIRLVMGVIVVIFVVVIFVTNAALRLAVVRPVIQIARLAHLIDNDTLTPDSLELAKVQAIARQNDELGDTAKALQKMAADIYARVQTLRQEIQTLRIQIDTDKEAQQVEEIVESDYFRHLQDRVKQIRNREDRSTRQSEGSSESAKRT